MYVPAGKLKTWIALATPEGLLLLATVLALRLEAVQDALPGFAHFYPYAVFIVGALLAWRFQRSRLLFALIVLALASSALPVRGGGAGAAGRVAFAATAQLLPLNLAGLALLADRGTLTPFGLLRLGAIAAQVIGVDLLRRTAPAAAASVLSHALLPAKLFAWSPVSQPALLAFLVAVVITALPLVFEPNATGRGFLWAIVASFLAVGARRPGSLGPVYLGTAGLILVVAVIEASYLLAYQDGLTQLPARRALTEAMQRLAGQYAVAMVDVDHFKKFNDEYGHDVGDQVLRMVASKLAQVEGGGRAYRYGGEEFAIIFAGKDVEETLPHLEAVREEVADAAFTIRRRIRRKRAESEKGSRRRRIQVSITVSIGVAAKDTRHANPDQVIRAADQALYLAKQAGRNRLRS
jgi:diguanylate cyclase (GGDEF)-like protein